MRYIAYVVFVLGISLTSANAADLPAQLKDIQFDYFMKAVDEPSGGKLAEGWEVELGFTALGPAFDVEPSPYLIVRDDRKKQVGKIQPSLKVRAVLGSALSDAFNDYVNKEFEGIPLQTTLDNYPSLRLEIVAIDSKERSATFKFKFPAQRKE